MQTGNGRLRNRGSRLDATTAHYAALIGNLAHKGGARSVYLSTARSTPPHHQFSVQIQANKTDGPASLEDVTDNRRWWALKEADDVRMAHVFEPTLDLRNSEEVHSHQGRRQGSRILRTGQKRRRQSNTPDERLELKVWTYAFAGFEQWSKILVAPFPIQKARLDHIAGVVYLELQAVNGATINRDEFLKVSAKRNHVIRNVKKSRDQQKVGEVTLEFVSFNWNGQSFYSLLMEANDLTSLLDAAVEHTIYKSDNMSFVYSLTGGSFIGYPAHYTA